MCVDGLDQMFESINISSTVIPLEGIEPAVTSIFGVSDNVEYEIDFLKISGLDEIGSKPQNHAVLILTRTVIHYNCKFLTRLVRFQNVKPFELVD